MKKALTSGLVLLVLGLVCGLILALVNSLTAPIILSREQRAMEEALGNVLGSEWNVSDFDAGTKPVEYENSPISKAYFLKVEGVLKVAVYQVVTAGFKGPITSLIAVDDQMKVLGYQQFHKESPGFGKDAIDEQIWYMVGVTLPDMSVFDTTGGATFTRNAVREAFELVASQAAIDFGGVN